MKYINLSFLCDAFQTEYYPRTKCSQKWKIVRYKNDIDYVPKRIESKKKIK